MTFIELYQDDSKPISINAKHISTIKPYVPVSTDTTDDCKTRILLDNGHTVYTVECYKLVRNLATEALKNEK